MWRRLNHGPRLACMFSVRGDVSPRFGLPRSGAPTWFDSRLVTRAKCTPKQNATMASGIDYGAIQGACSKQSEITFWMQKKSKPYMRRLTGNYLKNLIKLYINYVHSRYIDKSAHRVQSISPWKEPPFGPSLMYTRLKYKLQKFKQSRWRKHLAWSTLSPINRWLAMCHYSSNQTKANNAKRPSEQTRRLMHANCATKIVFCKCGSGSNQQVIWHGHHHGKCHICRLMQWSGTLIGGIIINQQSHLMIVLYTLATNNLCLFAVAH